MYVCELNFPRKEFQDLIKGKEYNFIGRTNIGNTTKIQTFIKSLNKFAVLA